MRKYFAEFFGTALLLIFTTTALIYTQTFQTGNLFDAMGLFGLTLAVLMFIFGPMAHGGHFNPAVSLGAAINKDITWKEFGAYILSQLLGALAGLGLAVITLVPVINSQASSSSSSSSSSVKASQVLTTLEPSATVTSLQVGLAVEFFFTFLFVLITLLALKKHAKQAPAIMGMTFAVVSYVAYPLTAGLVNPARALAPAFFNLSSTSVHLWFFLIVEIIAGALAGLVMKYLAPKPIEE